MDNLYVLSVKVYGNRASGGRGVFIFLIFPCNLLVILIALGPSESSTRSGCRRKRNPLSVKVTVQGKYRAFTKLPGSKSTSVCPGDYRP
jgi:hypothetical protein